jgi:hypothetical protein
VQKTILEQGTKKQKKRGNIKRNCIICGKEFYRHASDIKGNWGKYCSRSCGGKGTKRNEETRRKLSECKQGEKHPNWKGGISFEPYCPKFNADLKRRVNKMGSNDT